MINIFETSFEARERRFQIEKLYHGETVDLVGVVTTNGVPQNIMGYAVSGVFQPTSMNGSPDFYELSADIVDNKVLVHWEKGKDFGENSYMVWALLTDGDNASYPIVWRLDMAYSPSYPLSALDPIPRTIDFDKYDLLNAPWLPLSDVQSVEEDVLLSVADGFLPLSGGTIDGSLNVIREISAENFTAKAGVGINIGNSTVEDNGVAIGFNSTVTHGSVAIGNGIESDGFGNTNIGIASKATGHEGVALGFNSEISTMGIAVGYRANATVPGSIAVGTSTYAQALNAIQLGSLVLDDSSQIPQYNTTPHSLRVMDKMVLSGDNLTLDPERIPYLSDYETKAQAAIDHEELSVELTAYVEERIGEIPQPEPPPVAGVLTIKQNDSVVVEYNPDDETDITATITVPDVPTDMSACLSSAEFQSESYLPTDSFGAFNANAVSLEDIGNKLNKILQLLKRDSVGPSGGDPTKTYVKYSDNSIVEYTINGTLSENSIQNGNTAIEVKVGNTVDKIQGSSRSPFALNDHSMLTSITLPNSLTALGSKALRSCDSLSSLTIPEGVKSFGTDCFAGCHVLTSLTLPSTMTSIGNYAFFACEALQNINIPSSVTSIAGSVLGGGSNPTFTFTDRTKAQVQGMSGFRWGVGTNKIVCTDGTL